MVDTRSGTRPHVVFESSKSDKIDLIVAITVDETVSEF